jgi:putative ABC transport system substrate-binding protein
MVLNPVKERLVESYENPGEGITGVSVDVSAYEQFKKILQIIPGVSRVGVIYDPLKSESIINDAEQAAEKLNLKLVKAPVSSSKNVHPAIESLKGTVDILWSIPDTTVYSSAYINVILLLSIRNNIPIIGFSSSFAKAGAVLGIYSDYEDIGKKTADLIVKLTEGTQLSAIPVVRPDKLKVAINLSAAKNFSIKFSKEHIEAADEVFE